MISINWRVWFRVAARSRIRSAIRTWFFGRRILDINRGQALALDRTRCR